MGSSPVGGDNFLPLTTLTRKVAWAVASIPSLGIPRVELTRSVGSRCGSGSGEATVRVVRGAGAPDREPMWISASSGPESENVSRSGDTVVASSYSLRGPSNWTGNRAGSEDVASTASPAAPPASVPTTCCGRCVPNGSSRILQTDRGRTSPSRIAAIAANSRSPAALWRLLVRQPAALVT